ncbi:MAG TPA: hypothetical protein VG097_20670, partial [Gemmata sp.]|nr:hypothetical protein [Gemmata sp.]
MSFTNWLGFINSLSFAHAKKRRGFRMLERRDVPHLLLESLEDRVVPAATLLHDFGTNVDEIGTDSSFYPQQAFTQAGELVYFPASVPTNPVNVEVVRNELWVTNGTAAGTRMINDSTVTDSTYSFDLTPVGNTMFFFANDSAGHPQLWSYSGSGSPRQITNSTSFFSAEGGMVAIGTTLYYPFIANGEYQLFSYNTATPSSPPSEINFSSNVQPDPSGLTAVGNTLYFFGVDANGNGALYSYSGSGTPTELTSPFTNPYDPTAFGSTLYFAASDLSGATQLWQVTSGSSNATEIKVGTNSDPAPAANGGPLTVVGDTMYFDAFDVNNHEQLWSYGGSGSPTQLTNGSFFDVTDLTPAGNTLYFTATNSAETANALYSVNGSSVSQITIGTAANPAVQSLDAVGNTLYFAAFDGSNVFRLWEYAGSGSPSIVTVDPTGPSG